ncbi:transposase [Marinobacter zhanjiangensis]|uniref:Transposase n=1 Tax=Marinobacter zhanjiangensis TaxID=578215 RepID=A0ABQ3B5D1_9GAMM|nr:transposase [Marinobacter zhanjiangensis]GGY76231.1 transposase [Marinobacter zhanjiangensis]
MPRAPRFCPAGVPQHVIQRGVNRQFCFFDELDKGFYSRLLAEYAEEHQVLVHAWVLMTNHIHLLCTPLAEPALSRMMQSVGRRYVRYFNHRHERTGGLWEGRFKSFMVESERYLLSCQRYIELNPVRAGMVRLPEQYVWSSFQCHGRGRDSALHTPHEEYLRLGPTPAERIRAYHQLFEQTPAEGELQEVRQCMKTGYALGSEAFRKRLEQQYGLPQRPRRRGRPPKDKNGV